MGNNITDRLIEYCESKNIRQIDLISNGLGSKQTINFIWNGKQKPTLKFLSKFLLLYSDIDVKWLITGKKEVYDHNEYEINKEKIASGVIKKQYRLNDLESMVVSDNDSSCTECMKKDAIIRKLQTEKHDIIHLLMQKADELNDLIKKLKE